MDVRKICFEKINEIINNKDISEKIEDSIYNYSIEQAQTKYLEVDFNNNSFKRIYVNKLRTLYNNLDENSYVKNINFKNKILNNEFNLEKIAFLTPQEINNDHWKKYIDRQDANDQFLYSRTVGIRTDVYKCKRCKANDCTFYQLQVRCSDEPMTTFVNCLNCGKRWSIN